MRSHLATIPAKRGMTNATESFIHTGFAQGVAGLFTWAALFITGHQVCSVLLLTYRVLSLTYRLTYTVLSLTYKLISGNNSLKLLVKLFRVTGKSPLIIQFNSKLQKQQGIAVSFGVNIIPPIYFEFKKLKSSYKTAKISIFPLNSRVNKKNINLQLSGINKP